MPCFPNALCLSLLGCTWLISLSPVVARAQLSINLDDDDDVVLQNGNQPPLVVKPGQSFGGQLTSRGFEGVMSGPEGTKRVMPQANANPFRDVVKPKSQPLKIKAGDLSLTLPMTAPVTTMDKPALPRQKLQAARSLVRLADPKAMAYVDKLLRDHAPDPDLMQMKALLLLQANKDRDAAAYVYDALRMDTCWTWPMLRMSLPDRDAATAMYRRLQQSQRDQPSLEHDVLLAWWEHMLDHRPQAVAMMHRAAKARPHDPLFLRLMTAWDERTTDDAPPPVQP